MKSFLAAILSLLFLSGAAQNAALIDSLAERLKISPPGSAEQFRLLTSIGWEYRFARPDSTIYFEKMAYELGKKLNLGSDLARPLNYLGVAYNYKGELGKSYDYSQSALTTAESQKDSVQLAYANNNIGRLLFEQGIVAKSFVYFSNALKIFMAINDRSGIAYVKQSLADLYQVQEDYVKAGQLLKQALTLRLQLGKTRDISSAYAQLGTHYQKTNNLDSSSYYFLLSDSGYLIINDAINLARTKVLLAQNYLLQGKIQDAKLIGREGFEYIQSNKNVRRLPEAYLLMGKIYMAEKDYARAQIEFSAALTASKLSQQSVFELESYFNLAHVSKLLGRYQDEIKNMNYYLLLKDSVEDLELARKVERLQFELQIASKEKENELLKLQQTSTQSIIARQRLGSILLLVVAIFLLILAFIGWQVSKRRRLVNEKLATQNQQIIVHQGEIDQQNGILSRRNQMLSDLNHEKNTLMSIVAHDLKSPLNRIKGLLSLVKMEGTLTPQQSEYIQMINQVTAGGESMINDLLDVHEIEESNYNPIFRSFDLFELLAERVSSFKVNASSKGIRLNCSFATVSAIITSESSYVSRIVDNLLSNAIKFSPSGKEVQITARVEGNRALFAVKDQGPGFSDQDKHHLYKKFMRLSARPTAFESSNGLGLAIVKILIERLGGEIILDSQVGAGSEFTISVPTGNAEVASESESTVA